MLATMSKKSIRTFTNKFLNMMLTRNPFHSMKKTCFSWCCLLLPWLQYQHKRTDFRVPSPCTFQTINGKRWFCGKLETKCQKWSFGWWWMKQSHSNMYSCQISITLTVRPSWHAVSAASDEIALLIRGRNLQSTRWDKRIMKGVQIEDQL